MIKSKCWALSLSALFSFASCNQFIKMTDDSYYQRVEPVSGAESLKLVFSHNINGETHPCGCRKFPLGGLPQVAGYLGDARKSGPVIYVDTGDMLFPSPNVPETMKDSISFTAKKLVEAQNKLGLRYFVPGDQDFALGVDYLAKLSRSSDFEFLIANLKASSKIKARPFALVEANGVKLALIGAIDPSLVSKNGGELAGIEQAIEKALKKVAKEPEAEGAKIVLLVHAGLSVDEKLAKRFPQVDWIIGAHSQSFLRFPEEVGDSKIVQGLSRNHYIGEITFPFNSKEKASYKLVPMDETMDKKIENNSMTPWLASFKSELEKIQATEQSKLSSAEPVDHKLKTYLNCSECHKPQTEFWQGTAHSLAWQTLLKAKASNNPQCIGCHSLGYQKPEGFLTTAGIIEGENLNDKKKEAYWKEVHQTFKGLESVRELKEKKRRELSEKWVQIDKKHGIESNFSNVQCLNCHAKHPEHPFNMEDGPKQDAYANKCLSCHTADQAPEWYNKDESGLATTPNKKYLERKIKAVACPKM